MTKDEQYNAISENVPKVYEAGQSSIASLCCNALIGEKTGDVVTVDDVSPINNNLSVVSNIEPNQGEGVPSFDNVLPLSPRTGVTLSVGDGEFSVAFGQEIYGGTFDWSTGVLTIDRAKHIVTETDRWYEAETDSSYKGVDNRHRYELPYSRNPSWLTDFRGSDSVIVDKRLSCSTQKTTTAGDTWYNKEGIASYEVVGKETQRSLYFYLEQYATDFEAFKQAMIGTEIVYGLRNPVTIQLTPQQIEALGEITTLSSDTGDTTVKYNRDINKAFAELQQAIISLGGNV